MITHDQMSGTIEEAQGVIEMTRPSRQEVVTRIEPASQGALTPMDMLNQAVSQGATMDVLEKLMTLHERWEGNQARKAFDAAIAAAKAELPVIIKNKTVDFTSAKGRTNYRHETLDEIARAITPVLSKHGLQYRFRTSSHPSEPVTVTCIISHRDGHSEENSLQAGRDESGNKNALQAIGSAVTYLQRYTLKAALGLAAGEDDDGRAAGGDDAAMPRIPDDAAAKLRDELRDLIELTGASVSKLCKMAGVSMLSEIPAADLPAAINSVRTYGRNKGTLQ